MSQNRPGGVFSGLRMGGMYSLLSEQQHNPCIRLGARALTYTFRGGTRKGARWSHGRDERDAVHTVQDCRQRIIRSGLSNKALSQRRGCCNQASASRQAVQGMLKSVLLNTLAANMRADV